MFGEQRACIRHSQLDFAKESRTEMQTVSRISNLIWPIFVFRALSFIGAMRQRGCENNAVAEQLNNVVQLTSMAYNVQNKIRSFKDKMMKIKIRT